MGSPAKSPVKVKRRQKGEETWILCHSEGRKEKDRAIREKQEERFLKDVEKLQRRIEKGPYKGGDRGVAHGIGRGFKDSQGHHTGRAS